VCVCVCVRVCVRVCDVACMHSTGKVRSIDAAERRCISVEA